MTREVGGGMEDVECVLLKSQYRRMLQAGEVNCVDAAERSDKKMGLVAQRHFVA